VKKYVNTGSQCEVEIQYKIFSCNAQSFSSFILSTGTYSKICYSAIIKNRIPVTLFEGVLIFHIFLRHTGCFKLVIGFLEHCVTRPAGHLHCSG
jgi:hypothetical protein